MIDILYSNPLFLSFSTIISLVLLGVYLRNINFLTKDRHQFLIEFILQILLPSMIICSFMRDTSVELLENGINIFIWGIIVHLIMYIIGIVIYKNNNMLLNGEQIVLSNLLLVGSISTFGLAAVSIFYDDNGVFVNNIFNIPARIFIYTIGFISISGLKIQKGIVKKIFMNPVMIATILGIMFFFFQEYTPYVRILNKNISIFRIDYTMPFIFNSLESLSKAFLPMIWITIGASIEKDTLLYAIKSYKIIVFSILKIIICPILFIIIYILLKYFNIFMIDSYLIAPTLLLLICPPANILIVFALKYNRAPQLALSCFIISNILAIILLPFYAILFEYLILLSII